MKKELYLNKKTNELRGYDPVQPLVVQPDKPAVTNKEEIFVLDENGKPLIVENAALTETAKTVPVPLNANDLAVKQALADGFVKITDKEVETWQAEQQKKLQQAADEVVPEVLTMAQTRLVLLQAGKLADVDKAIDSLPSPQKEAARIQWEYETVVKRNSVLVKSLAPSLGLSEAQIDALFKAGKAL